MANNVGIVMLLEEVRKSSKNSFPSYISHNHLICLVHAYSTRLNDRSPGSRNHHFIFITTEQHYSFFDKLGGTMNVQPFFLHSKKSFKKNLLYNVKLMIYSVEIIIAKIKYCFFMKVKLISLNSKDQN